MNAIDRDGFGKNRRGGVDHVKGALRRADPYEDATTILGDGDIVWPAAQEHFLQNLTALAIHDVEHAFRFVADIDSCAIGRKGDSMRQLYAMNHLDDSVGCGIDNIDCVSRAVGDVDECRWFWRRRRACLCSRTSHP